MELLKAYACYNTDKDIRLSSSSGGIFSSLADHVLRQQGIVYGVKMSEDCYSAEFTRVVNHAELIKLRGSKYLQAKVGKTFGQIRDDLRMGKLVLFSGTGCQVNGLKSFLGKDYDNLLCVDVICHGVPSHALWKKYVQHQEQKARGKLRGINFRCKDDNWADFGMKVILDDIPQMEQRKVYVSKDKDPYMQMFLRNYCLRPSCYECIAKNVKKSDLTIADFWGINKIAPEMNDGNGTSFVLIRTDKGRETFEAISRGLKLKEVSYEDGVRNNSAEYQSCRRPLQRDAFFNDMKGMSFDELEKKYVAPIKMSFKSRVRRKIKNRIRAMFRVICFGGGYKHNEEYGLLFVFRV